MAEDTSTSQAKFCGISPTPLPPNDPDVNNSAISAFPVKSGIQVTWTYPSSHPELVAFSKVYRSTEPAPTLPSILEPSDEPADRVDVRQLGWGWDGETNKIFVDLPFSEEIPDSYEIGDDIFISSDSNPDWKLTTTITDMFNRRIITSADRDESFIDAMPDDAYIIKLVWSAGGVDLSAVNLIGRVSADNYTDILNENQKGTTFYYWVQHISVHGTEGNLIGPASATWNGSIDEILELLQGMVESSLLDEHLREQIFSISDLIRNLDQEVQTRTLQDAILVDMIKGLARDLEAIDTLVANSVLEFKNDNIALAAQINIVLAKWNENLALVVDYANTFTTKNAALAYRMSQVESSLLIPGSDPPEYWNVSVQEEMVASILDDTLDLGSIGPIYDNDGNEIEIPELGLADHIEGLYGQYSVKVDVNGYVSGFGLRSTENYSEFIVNANTFAIGAPTDHNNPDSLINNAVNPFIVTTNDNGQSTIAMNTDVFIKNGTIKNAMIDNVITSTNWNWNNGNFTGWHINKNGDAYFDNLTAKGNITANHIEAGSANIIDTLMIQGNAVTIPQGAREPWGGSTLSQRIEIKESPNGTNLVTCTVIWKNSEEIPNAFIVNAIYQALGSGITTNKAKYGDAHIELVAEYGYMHPSNSSIKGPRETYQILQSYGVTLKEGDGSQVTGIWHVVPLRPSFGKPPYHWAHFTIRGMTKHSEADRNREVTNAVITVLGAKR